MPGRMPGHTAVRSIELIMFPQTAESIDESHRPVLVLGDRQHIAEV